VRPADPPPVAPDDQYVALLSALCEPFGVTRTGVCDAAVLGEARAALHDRIERGFDAGLAFTFKNPERSTDPQRAVAGARSVFVAARPYLLDDVPSPGPTAARVGRYAWVDHYAPLRSALWEVAHRLRADGWKAVPFADDNSIVDRAVAHRAGLGWFGKNANILVPGAGSWFVLGCVVTTAPLPVAGAPVADGCGQCRSCLDACPTGAIVEPGVIDAGRCLAWVLQRPGSIPVELREAVGDRLYGCDDCQTSCPPSVTLGERRGRAAARSAVPASDAEPVHVRAWVDALDLLEADDDEVMATWGRWYLHDRDPRWVRRNALVVLGNAAALDLGSPLGARVGAVLEHYRAHHDPVLREHAEWAVLRRAGTAA